MAKYTVTFGGCGHTDTIELFGPHKERERKIAWLEREGICPNCYRAEKEAEKAEARAKAAAEAEAIESALNLPKLKGSEKQVAWAKTIRTEILKKFDETLEKYATRFENHPNGAEVKKMLEDAKEKIMEETSASWFIDNRFYSVQDLVINFLKNLR